MRLIPFVLCTVLIGCGDWPDVGGETRVGPDTPWPQLQPIGDVEGGVPSATRAGEGERLAARATALQARARLMRRDLPDRAAFEALRARLGR